MGESLLIKQLLHLDLLMPGLLDLLLEQLNLGPSTLPLVPQIPERLVILTPRIVPERSQDARVVLLVAGLLQFFQAFGRLYAILGAHLLVLILCVHLLALLLGDALANGDDLLDQLDVVRHDLQVVSLVNLTLNFETLLERVHRVLEELPLVLVLLLDVRIDVSIFGLLVLDEPEQAVVHRDLQLLVIVCVLHHLVDGILEAVDVGVVVAHDVAVRHDGFLDDALTHAQVLNHEAERGVHLVVLLEALVHRACAKA